MDQKLEVKMKGNIYYEIIVQKSLCTFLCVYSEKQFTKDSVIESGCEERWH